MADPRAQEIRRAALRQWGRDPAGALAVGDGALGTAESFAAVERFRYAQQPWMGEVFGFDRFAGRRVLEIGVGLGTDHAQFARAGAVLTGIDLTPRCVELTRTRFAQEGLASDLRVMDAEQLAFADDAFDAVYSFGVLHHVASAERAFAEVRRVLRPGGVFLGGLYNRWSVFAAVMLADRLRRAEWRHESVAERLARVEYSSAGSGTDTDRPAPYVRLFGARELRRALHGAGFGEVELVTRHLGVRRLESRLPAGVCDLLARRAGWYLVHRAS
jgi:SAM-dependent methyltransferase